MPLPRPSRASGRTRRAHSGRLCATSCSATGVSAALTLLVAALALEPGTVRAQPEAPSAGFAIARLKYGGGGDWYSNPSSLPNLSEELQRRTTVAVDRVEDTPISILDPEFFNYPFLYMNGHGTVKFTDTEVARLRKYLLSGGFLFADDNYGMDESFRREMARIFPDRELVEVPWDHPIYHCFYDLPDGPPKVHEHDGKPSQGLGVFDGPRLVVFYTYQADIGDGLEDPEVHKDPAPVREAAMRMAINTVVYAMTH